MVESSVAVRARTTATTSAAEQCGHESSSAPSAARILRNGRSHARHSSASSAATSKRWSLASKWHSLQSNQRPQQGAWNANYRTKAASLAQLATTNQELGERGKEGRSTYSRVRNVSAHACCSCRPLLVSTNKALLPVAVIPINRTNALQTPWSPISNKLHVIRPRMLSTPSVIPRSLEQVHARDAKNPEQLFSPASSMPSTSTEDLPNSSEGLTPARLFAQAQHLDVDLAREPFLLPLVRQVATMPRPPTYCTTDENQPATTEGSYFQQQIRELRARHAADPQPSNAWVEFEDSEGVPYYFDFVNESRRDTHPLVRLRDSTIGGGSGDSASLCVADPEVFEHATALHKLPSMKKCVKCDCEMCMCAASASDASHVVRVCSLGSLEQLEILCFHVWWTEHSLQGEARRRLVHIYFSVPTRHFQVVLEDTDDVFTISHIVGLSGRPLAAWDLHVGARIKVLGRLTTLMQASLLTRQWLQVHERRLSEVKRQLQTELAKYELKAHGRPHQAGRIECADPHRSQAGCSLRLLLGDIALLKHKLTGYRPDLARRICADIPEETE